MYSYSRNFYGKLRGCIFDWSGTLVDKYSIAPVKSLMDTFKNYDIDVSYDEIRDSMGIRKDKHIEAILEIPNIRYKWLKKYGSEPNQSMVEEITLQYQMCQLDSISDYTELIPGVKSALLSLRNRHRLKLGGTTGFYNNITSQIQKDILKRDNVSLDSFVSGDDVEYGSRPNPFMLFRCMTKMNIDNVRTIVKVDDTVSGVEEGLNAGVWTVGVYRYSNYMNINTLEELENLAISDYSERINKSRDILSRSGAHYVIENLSQMETVVNDINMRLSRGECP